MVEKSELNTYMSNLQMQAPAVTSYPNIFKNKPAMPNSIFGSSVNDYSNDIMCQNLNFMGNPQINTTTQQTAPTTQITEIKSDTKQPEQPETEPAKPNNKAKYIGAGTGFILPAIPKFIELAKGAKFKDVFKLKFLALPCLVLSAAGYAIGKLTGDCLSNRGKTTGSTP